MTDSKHHFNLKGADAEKLAHSLAVKSFFTDWCYLNPLLEDGKELCDLLVVFDRVAIIWQIKNLKLRQDGHLNPRELKKNVKQLAGAARRLMDARRPVTLSNPRRGDEVFDPETIERVYLISVLAGEQQAVLPAIDVTGGRTVHVFTGDFMQTALEHLDTVADFVDYLDAKETLLNSGQRLVINGGEEELVAIYLMNHRTFGPLQGATVGFIGEGSWEAFLQREEVNCKQRADEVSYSWDNMINVAHDGGTPEYEILAREMARLSRFQRRCIAKAFYEAHEIAHKLVGDGAYRRVVSFDGRTYAFLFMDDSEPRDHRRAALSLLCYVARGQFPESQSVIGVATEMEFRSTCSYDFCYLHIPEWTDDDAAQAEKIRAETGILANPHFSEAHEDEFPASPGH